MKISANGLAIEVDDQGEPNGEPVLLVMGLGMQLIGWPDELVQLLLQRGYRVLRFDNRDIGCSQWLDHLGIPALPWAALRQAMGLAVQSPYSLADMAADTLAVIDAMGLPRVHLVGASMGGMIAQHLAAGHPGRVQSLTLMMTTAGARHLPQPPLHLRRALMSAPASLDPSTLIAHLENLYRLIGSPAYPPAPERLRQRTTMAVMRAWHPAGTARQAAAIIADGDRTPLLARIGAPTHVIHGELDPLVPAAAAQHLAEHITGATLDLVPGMGHDLPLPLLPRLAEGIALSVERTRVR